MDEQITFRTEIEFKGSIEEFREVAARLVELPIRIRVEWPPGHLAGCWPVAPEELLNPRMLEAITEEAMAIDVIKGINGGIRDPHLHWRGEMVFLNREQFKELVGNAAMQVAGEIAERAQYADSIGVIRNLAEMGRMV
jgi:hypothetical protein